MSASSLLAIDTNVLAYGMGLRSSPNDDAKLVRSATLLARFDNRRLVLPSQVIIEAHNLFRRKGGPHETRLLAALDAVCESFPIHWVTKPILDAAIALTDQHKLQVFDAVILAAAADAGCAHLLTEDMAEGFVWRGCRASNPFAAAVHPDIAAMLPR
jgi:predicted nucleic acid-binding protein